LQTKCSEIVTGCAQLAHIYVPSERILLGACFLLFIKENEWVRQDKNENATLGRVFILNFDIFMVQFCRIKGVFDGNIHEC
jgi:hypothetical protein